MRSLFLILAFAFISINIEAQEFRTPRPSPVAMALQTVGVTDVTINYSRPGVKGRTIWGDVVPYDKVWRTGANEVTSIIFTDDVKINGQALPAGTYGLHSIPGEKEWTFIFSKNTEVGGSAEFKEDNAVLRVKANAEQSEFNERMNFTFTDVTDNSAKLNLAWDKIKIPLTIETNTKELTLAKANELIDWSVPMQAATYCLQNNTNIEQAIKWINASTLINENYWNMRIKAQLLEKSGNKQEAVSVMEKAIEHGKKMESRPFDFENMEKMLAQWKS